MTQLIQLEMVGFRKLHSPIWACNMCEKLTPHDDVNTLLEHLKNEHKIEGVTIDADGGAWITETTN